MIARACRIAEIELPEAEQLEYEDASLCADWAVENIAQMTTLNLLKGVEDNAFAPTETATRAQAAVVIYRFMNMIGVND